jgi:hypothetical protein
MGGKERRKKKGGGRGKERKFRWELSGELQAMASSSHPEGSPGAMGGNGGWAKELGCTDGSSSYSSPKCKPTAEPSARHFTGSPYRRDALCVNRSLGENKITINLTLTWDNKAYILLIK